jgi:hypothetical protein
MVESRVGFPPTFEIPKSGRSKPQTLKSMSLRPFVPLGCESRAAGALECGGWTPPWPSAPCPVGLALVFAGIRRRRRAAALQGAPRIAIAVWRHESARSAGPTFRSLRSTQGRLCPCRTTGGTPVPQRAEPRLVQIRAWLRSTFKWRHKDAKRPVLPRPSRPELSCPKRHWKRLGLPLHRC